MNTVKQIGEILKSKRTSKNLTQKQTAVLAFNDPKEQSLISRIESGSFKTVSFENITIVLEALGVDLIGLISKTN